MRIIIDVNEFLITYHKLKSAFHSCERSESSTNCFVIDTKLHRNNGCRNCIFHVMETGDAKLNFFELQAWALKIEFKKSVLCFYIAGKKLSPIRTISFFSNMFCFIRQ